MAVDEQLATQFNGSSFDVDEKLGEAVWIKKIHGKMLMYPSLNGMSGAAKSTAKLVLNQRHPGIHDSRVGCSKKTEGRCDLIYGPYNGVQGECVVLDYLENATGMLFGLE